MRSFSDIFGKMGEMGKKTEVLFNIATLLNVKTAVS